MALALTSEAAQTVAACFCGPTGDGRVVTGEAGQWLSRMSERAGSVGEPSGLPREEGAGRRGAGTVLLTRLPEAREARSNCLFVCSFEGIGATGWRSR